MVNSMLKLVPLNPILLRVVSAGGRRLRHAFTRWIYLGLLIAVLLVAMLASGSGGKSLSDLAKAASQVFMIISYVQLGMICLLAPVFTAGAITQERDSRTYNILLSTPLTNSQIVMGSLLSRLFYVLALLLSGVPVFAITLFYGGVTAQSIVLSFSIAFTTALLTGSLAIAIAVFRLGSGKTVFWFYVFNAVFLVSIYMIDAFALRSVGGITQTTFLTGMHPFLALESVVRPTDYPRPDMAALTDRNFFIRWYLGQPAYAYVTLTFLASLLMVVPSAIVLRRIAQRSEIGLWSYVGNILRRGREANSRKARHVWHNPVAWREAATRAGFSGRGLARWLTIIFGIGLALVLIYLLHSGQITRTQTRGILLGLIIVEFSVALLVATNTSASAVTKERESQTLDLLLVTPITSRYYIWGKLRGLVSFMIPFALVPTVTVILTVVYDLFFGAIFNDPIVKPEMIILLPVYLTTLLAWACMLGLQLSLKWSKTIVAVMASVGVIAGICSVLGVCGSAAAHQLNLFGLVVAAFSPFSAITVMIDPERFAPSTFAPGTGVPPAEGLGRVVLFISVVVASVAYCLLVWTMYRSMVKNFDMIIRRQHS